MYVRWQLSKSQAKNDHLRKRKRIRMRAILVENIRVDGKPRQKHIAFLGSFSVQVNTETNEDSITYRAGRNFWRSVGDVLDRLSNRITQTEREKIIATIQETIDGYPPTPEEMEQHEREWAEHRKQIQEAFAGFRSRPKRERHKKTVAELKQEINRLDERIRKMQKDPT